MIVEPGVLVPARLAGVVAHALRMLAASNGGLPPATSALLAEFEAVSRSATSAVGSSGSVAAPPVARLQNVMAVGCREAAARISRTERNVRDLCRRGALDAEMVGGRWVIRPEALDEYARRRDGRR